jgi:hypothetical protein
MPLRQRWRGFGGLQFMCLIMLLAASDACHVVAKSKQAQEHWKMQYSHFAVRRRSHTTLCSGCQHMHGQITVPKLAQKKSSHALGLAKATGPTRHLLVNCCVKCCFKLFQLSWLVLHSSCGHSPCSCCQGESTCIAVAGMGSTSVTCCARSARLALHPEWLRATPDHPFRDPWGLLRFG